MARETYEAEVTVSAMLEALQEACDRAGVESFKELRNDLELDVQCRIEDDMVANAARGMGYVHKDDALDGLDLNIRDFADGLRALMEGDRTMAATLIARGLDQWPDAALAAETVLLSRTVHDRRQLSLLALAA